MDLSQSTKNLISKYILWKNSLKTKEGVPTVHVDEVASKVAVFYEQIRTIIDWREEHLMRRAAITRKLKRRFMDIELGNFSADNIAEALVPELIRGGYFPNNKIEESKVAVVQKIINKYVFIFKNNSEDKKGKTGSNFFNQLLEVAACEIEEGLATSIKEMALIDFMFERMRKSIKVNEKIYEEKLLEKEDKDIQIYIAIQKALFKFDEPIIIYNLIRYKYPIWETPPENDWRKISQNMRKILIDIENYMNHPLGKKFYAICEKYDTPYLLLGDILTKESMEKTIQEIHDPSLLEKHIRNAYMGRLIYLKTKIKRAALYSTISIFLTKILSLIILEVILMKAFENHPNFAYIAVDVLLPTFLMGFLVATIRPPSAKNLNLAIIETIKIVYNEQTQDVYEIKIPKKKGAATRFILSLLYLSGAIISFGFIYWILDYFGFPVSSIIINIIFIALILFTGTIVRKRARELTIEEESAGVVGFLSDILLLPIMGLGQWLLKKWKKYNAIVLFFNVLIDMPFSAFVEFLERWRYFIKDKKEEIH